MAKSSVDTHSVEKVSDLPTDSDTQSKSSDFRVEILITGDELIEGQWRDEHSQLIAQQFKELGIRISRFTTVGDDIEELRAVLDEIVTRASLCVMTGGLGPTQDDLTLDVIAQVAGVQAPMIEATWQEILSRFPQLIRAEHSNRRQARCPEGAEQLQNGLGTAPIIKMKIKECTLFALPGVPKEFKWAMNTYVQTWLKESHSPQKKFHHRVLRVAQIGESLISEKIDALNLSPSVHVAYQSLGGEHRVKLKSTDLHTLEDALPKIKRVAGMHYLNDQDLSLNEQLIKTAKEAQLRFGFAESCTGGALSASITQVSGASAVFWGSIISYSNDVKQKQLKVPEAVLMQHGAVSEECAKYMALGARDALEVDWAVSVTGIAGPGGGTVEKPVGTVCFAWASATQLIVKRKLFLGDRADIQAKALAFAQFHLLKLLEA